MTKTFETGCEMLEVTSMNHPDPSWSYADKAGHVHRWSIEKKEDRVQYDLPTLMWIKDGEDEEGFALGHTECRVCREHVTSGYTADLYHVFIPGPRWYRIDGQRVSAQEYHIQMAEEAAKNPS